MSIVLHRDEEAGEHARAANTKAMVSKPKYQDWMYHCTIDFRGVALAVLQSCSRDGANPDRDVIKTG